MAFEQTPPPPQQPLPPVKRRGDSAAFYGILIGILILAAFIFIFRSSLAAKIAQWRGVDEKDLAAAPATATIAPATTTPTPTATATTTPRPTTTPRATATASPTFVASPPIYTGDIPTTGPADTLLLVGFTGTSLAAAGSSARYYVLRRRLHKQISSIEIV